MDNFVGMEGRNQSGRRQALHISWPHRLRIQLTNLPTGSKGAVGVILGALAFAVLYWKSVTMVMNGLARCLQKTYRVGLVLSTFQDLDHAFIFVGGAELVLQRGLASTVQDTLGAVTIVSLECIETSQSWAVGRAIVETYE